MVGQASATSLWLSIHHLHSHLECTLDCCVMQHVMATGVGGTGVTVGAVDRCRIMQLNGRPHSPACSLLGT
jgi:hypothetical protein